MAWYTLLCASPEGAVEGVQATQWNDISQKWLTGRNHVAPDEARRNTNKDVQPKAMKCSCTQIFCR